MGTPLAITGIGCITASGPHASAFAADLRHGTSRLVAHPQHAVSLLQSHPAGVVADPLPPATTRTSALALSAAQQALAASACPVDHLGLAVGTSTGGMPESEAAYLADNRKAHQIFRHQEYHHTTTTVAQHLQLGGPQATHSVACASAACAAIDAIEWVRQQRCPAAMIIGADALCRVTVDGFHALRLLDPHGCRPLSATRSGMSIGEGAGAVVIEHPNHARARGAPILASLLGWGLTTDAHHATAPEPNGTWLSQAIESALSDAQLTPPDVAYANLHGTGTPDNDPAEHAAIRHTCGDELPIASSKGITGHCMGAAAAIELVACVLAIENNTGWESVACDDPLSANVAQTAKPLTHDIILSTTLAFGGVNAALIIGGPGRCG